MRNYKCPFIDMNSHTCSQSKKAIEGAIQARQWNKAVQIVELQEPDIGTEYYSQIAKHYSSTRDYQLAEQYFTKADMAQDAVDMYIKADR